MNGRGNLLAIRLPILLQFLGEALVALLPWSLPGAVSSDPRPVVYMDIRKL